MSRFRRVGEIIHCTFHAAEYDLLVNLHQDLTGVVSHADHSDQRFRRLFPPAVLDSQMSAADDTAANRSWREQALTQHGQWLQSATFHRGIYKLMVPLDTIDGVLQLINDMRLMIGASIDIDVFDRDSLAADDERQYALAIIDHLAWWQEEILTLLADDDTTA
jgi:hypothetical protein